MCLFLLKLVKVICNLCINILFEIYYFKGVLVWIIFVLIYIIIDNLKY